MAHDPMRREEVNNAVERLSKKEVIEIGSRDLVSLYISLLQNSVYQAMNNSFLINKGLVTKEEYDELNKKNDEYHEAIDKFLISIADRNSPIDELSNERE